MAQQNIDNTAPDADTLEEGANKINANFTEVYGRTEDLAGGTTGQILKKNSNTNHDFVWGAESGGSGSQATETLAGIAEIATQTESNTGTNDTTFLTPLKSRVTGDARYQRKLNVLNVEDYGAVGDGTTNNLQAFKDWALALQAQGGGIGYIPPKDYLVVMALNAGGIHTFNGLRGLEIMGAGAKIIDGTDYTANAWTTYPFVFRNCKDVTVNIGTMQSQVVDATKGADFIYLDQGTSDVDIDVEFIGGKIGVSCVKLEADVDTLRCQGLKIDVKATDTYYPVSLQYSGDDAEIRINALRPGRAFFPYGVKNIKAHVRSKNQILSTVLGGHGSLENMELWFYDRESDRADSSNPAVTMSAVQPVSGERAVSLRNIKLHLDLKNSGSFRAGLQIRKQLSDSSPDTTQRGHILEGIRVHGTIESRAGQPPIDYSGLFTGTDVVRDCIISEDTRLSHVDTPSVLPTGFIRKTSGSGSPEGVVYASPGSVYSRIDGGAGTGLYVKETGVNTNTGWITNRKVESQIDVYTTTGAHTWTKPAGCTSVTVALVGGGAGGGSGMRGAASTVRCGGGGGGSGAKAIANLPASILGATESVTVGAGGSGGAAVAVDGTNGNPGGNGGISRFGSATTTSTPTLLQTVACAGGVGGTASLGTGGAGGFSIVNGAAGGSASATGAAGGNGGSSGVAGGGAAGGGITSGNAVSTGGAGGTSYAHHNVLTAATAAGANGNNGVDAVVNSGNGGTGAGGGGSSITATAGTGGNGGLYGGGGGGGGASLNGFASGAGGNGANGIAIVISHIAG